MSYKYFTSDSLLAHDQEIAKKTKALIQSEGGKINVIKVNGVEQTISATDKSVDITVPTDNKSLANGAGYQTSAEVSSAASAAASSAVATHNTDSKAHSDIRETLSNLTTKVNTALDSDDETLDQLSEIVAYIKSNKSLIDGITTGKVNTADMVAWGSDEVVEIVDTAFA